jgi:oligopeptide transport system substrate-binding protein
MPLPRGPFRSSRVLHGCALAFGALALGCATQDDGAYFGTTTRVGKAHDTFYVNGAGEPEYLDPGKISDTLSSALGMQLFEGLIKYDPRDDHPVQGVATHWDQSDDNRIFRFYLRPEAKWSDGKPVTAHDFAYAWKRVLRPSTASRSAANLYPLKNGELFSKGRLKVTKADTALRAEPVDGAAEVAKLPKGSQLLILGRSPVLVATSIQPLREVPQGRVVTRGKPDPKKGTPEEMTFGGAHPAQKASGPGWRDAVVRVTRAVRGVDCDGEADHWFEIRRGDERGYLPGCALKPAKEKTFALVKPYPAKPTFTVSPQAPAQDSPDGTKEVTGFVPESELVSDDGVVGVRATDDRTLEVELEQPTPYFIDLTAHTTLYPVRRDVIEPFEARGEADLWFRPENIVTNGPYALESWKFRYEITMKVNPFYWRADKIRTRRLVFIQVEQYHPTLNLYWAGDIDSIGDNVSLPPEYMPIVEKKKDFSRTNFLAIYWFELNTRKPPLDDVRVRRALNLATDKKQLITAITRGGQTPATHYVPDFTGLGYADRVEADRAAGTDPFAGPEHEHNPQRARELLKEAGYEVVKHGDGFRASNFPPLELLYNTNEAHRAIAVAMQDMWKRHLGVSVTLRNEEWKVMLKNYRDGNFQIMRFGQVADYNHPNSFLESFFAGNPQNQTGWSSTEFDETVQKAAREPDPNKSIQLYREAEKVAVAGMSRIPLYFYTRSNLVKPWVKGFWGSRRNVHHMEFFWIDPDWQKGAPNVPAFLPLELPKPGRIGPPPAPAVPVDKAPDQPAPEASP